MTLNKLKNEYYNYAYYQLFILKQKNWFTREQIVKLLKTPVGAKSGTKGKKWRELSDASIP